MEIPRSTPSLWIDGKKLLYQYLHRLTIRLMSEVDQQVSLMIPGRFASYGQDDSWQNVSTGEAKKNISLKAGQAWSVSF